MEKQMQKRMKSIERMLNAKTIAVIGASEKPGYSKSFFDNMAQNPFEGELIPINPKYGDKTLFGRKSYAKIGDVPHQVDLAVVIVRADFVIDILRECAEAGVASCLIITAGFSEADKVNGKIREERMKEIADESGMHICGPNTIGIANVTENAWMTGAGGGLDLRGRKSGRCAVISQSGAVGFGPVINTAVDYNIGLKYVVTTGNQADLDLCDFAEYMLQDDEIDCISILIEGLKDGERFLNIADKAHKIGKKLIVMKMGESSVGARAAASHTASMTGDIEVFNAVVKQYGAIKAEDYDELLGYTKITREPYHLHGNRLCAISHSGGISGFLGDQLAKNGFEIPVFTQETQEAINEYLKDFGSPRNPLDLTKHTFGPNLTNILKIVEENEDVDGFVIASYVNPDTAEDMVKALSQLSKPVYFVWTASVHIPGLSSWMETDFPLFFSISKAAKMLAKVYESDQVPYVEPEEQNMEKLDLSALGTGFVSENDAKELIKAIGVSIPESVTLETGNADSVEKVKFDGPYAMKIVSDTIIHKSDIGGVMLNIQSKADLKESYQQLLERTTSHANEIQGVLVEQLCPEGIDMILGVRYDAQFGPVMVLGLGGIYTELFKMTTIRVLPVSREEVERMLDEIPGVTKLLDGFRGGPVYDRNALVDAIYRISEFVSEHRNAIELLETNPIRVLPEGEGVRVLDCVIKIQ